MGNAEQEIPDLYPSCAVTRSMASKANQSSAQKAVDKNVTSNVDLADTFIGQIYSEANDPFPNHVNRQHVHLMVIHPILNMMIKGQGQTCSGPPQ